MRRHGETCVVTHWSAPPPPPSPHPHTTPTHPPPHHHHPTSHHITSHHITSHHITSHHITSHHITSHHITSHQSHHITSHHIIPPKCHAVQGVPVFALAAREGASSARRRRDRQLRAWHRHVRTTVAVELATALHHSAQGLKKRVVEEPREVELPVKHNATSGPIATPPWGVRPAHPLDVSAQPPLVAATCVAAGVPSPGCAIVGGRSG